MKNQKKFMFNLGSGYFDVRELSQAQLNRVVCVAKDYPMETNNIKINQAKEILYLWYPEKLI